jgi:hypothetical protein
MGTTTRLPPLRPVQRCGSASKERVLMSAAAPHNVSARGPSSSKSLSRSHPPALKQRSRSSVKTDAVIATTQGLQADTRHHHSDGERTRRRGEQAKRGALTSRMRRVWTMRRADGGAHSKAPGTGSHPYGGRSGEPGGHEQCVTSCRERRRDSLLRLRQAPPDALRGLQAAHLGHVQVLR